MDLSGCGIIEAKLIDPLNLLLDKITGNSSPNAVGLYYDNGADKKVLLFSVHDGNLLTWLKKPSQHPFVNEIIIHRAQGFNVDAYVRTVNLVTKSIVPNDVLEQYEAILLEKNRTGHSAYDIVNNVLSLLTGQKYVEPSRAIMDCPLLDRGVVTTMLMTKVTAGRVPMKYMRQGLVRLTSVFLGLFSDNVEFRNRVIQKGDITQLFLAEEAFVAEITKSISQGYISIPTVNDCIAALEKERVATGNSDRLHMVETNKENIIVMDKPILFTPTTTDGVLYKIKEELEKSRNTTDWRGFTTCQLYDVLIYIDSLKYNDGEQERYTRDQNDIVKELAKRRQ